MARITDRLVASPNMVFVAGIPRWGLGSLSVMEDRKGDGLEAWSYALLMSWWTFLWWWALPDFLGACKTHLAQVRMWWKDSHVGLVWKVFSVDARDFAGCGTACARMCRMVGEFLLRVASAAARLRSGAPGSGVLGMLIGVVGWAGAGSPVEFDVRW